MFCFFKNDSFVNFWSNQIGDVFCSLTIKNMKWADSEVDLVYYPGIEQGPEHFDFDSSKNLIIKEKIVTQVEVPALNEAGEPVLDESGNPVMNLVDEVSYQTKQVVDPVVYYAKGIMVKPC